VRGLRYHLRCWGPQGAPRLLMLHGWADTSASFQFTVDALARDWEVIAPDWRGNGASDWSSHHNTGWFPEFIADLEQLVDQLSPEAPVNLIGHSFGAAVGCVYAGVRPRRVARLLNIDGFGARSWKPEGAPQRYAELLALLKKETRRRDFAALSEVEKIYRKLYARVSPERVAFLARETSRINAQGRVELVNDPAQAATFPMFFSNRLDDSMACWRAITAPMLMLLARQGGVVGRADDLKGDGSLEKRLACFRTAEFRWLEDCGHMVHLEKPEVLAEAIEGFFPYSHPAGADGAKN
jgi:pimeloyl-ACP methyl ester carboxylesterase